MGPQDEGEALMPRHFKRFFSSAGTALVAFTLSGVAALGPAASQDTATWQGQGAQERQRPDFRYALPFANRPYADVTLKGATADVFYCPRESVVRDFTPCTLQRHEVCAPDGEMICLIGDWVAFAVPRENIPDRPYTFSRYVFEVVGEVPVERDGEEALALVIESYGLTAGRDEENRVVTGTEPRQRFLYSRQYGLIAVAEGHEETVNDELVAELRSRGNLLITEGLGFGARDTAPLDGASLEE